MRFKSGLRQTQRAALTSLGAARISRKGQSALPFYRLRPNPQERHSAGRAEAGFHVSAWVARACADTPSGLCRDRTPSPGLPATTLAILLDVRRRGTAFRVPLRGVPDPDCG